MKDISELDELESILVNGRAVEPIRLMASGKWNNVSFLKSFENITIQDGASLFVCSGITSLKGLKIGKNCTLNGLTSLTTLKGLISSEGCGYGGLLSLRTFAGGILAKDNSFSGLSRLDPAKVDVEFMAWPPGTKLYSVPDWLGERLPDHAKENVKIT